MTHPTDDEIMELAVRYFGEQAAHASTGLKRFARALLAEQARTDRDDDMPGELLVQCKTCGGSGSYPADPPLAAPLLTHKAEDAPSDAELLDSRGNIRSDLKSSAYCVGNEYKPFHPRASHVRPEWRDGWNACFVAAIAQERKA
jgi:hypothetical protein